MAAQRFDVLPVVPTAETLTHYFSTVEWNKYSNLNLNKISDSQKIYYRLSLKDLVRKFKTEDRHYYFLTDYDQILGLVSYVNLNCQLVYNYLFHIIADIERGVSNLLKLHIPQDEIIKAFLDSEDSHLIAVVEEYQKSIQSNHDTDIFLHMYLPNLGFLLNKFITRLPGETKRLGKYTAKFGPNNNFNLLRRKIMHPVRPILSDKDSIKQIDELLTDYFEIKQILHQ